MNHASLSFRTTLLLIALLLFIGAWLLMAAPAWAQGEESESPSMTQEFFDQPDLVAPLVVPMVLALGGVLSLIAFLGWIFTRMPENGEA